MSNEKDDILKNISLDEIHKLSGEKLRKLLEEIDVELHDVQFAAEQELSAIRSELMIVEREERDFMEQKVDGKLVDERLVKGHELRKKELEAKKLKSLIFMDRIRHQMETLEHIKRDLYNDDYAQTKLEELQKATEKHKLKQLFLKGFKSIGSGQTISFGDINVMIGANSAGKSNLVSFFKLIEAIVKGNLQSFIANQGTTNSVLFYGENNTKQFSADLLFVDDQDNYDLYGFSLEHSFGGQMMFAYENHEKGSVADPNNKQIIPYRFGSGHKESRTIIQSNDYQSQYLLTLLNGIRSYQFHNTSEDSAIRKPSALHDNRELRSDGSNLPSFLYQMKMREDRIPYYQRIVRRIGEIMPQFRDFDLLPMEENPNMIRLDWIDKHQGHKFGTHQISDGSLRFMALATLLLQPKETLPKIIVIDEPELGLHPEAMMDLVGMIQIAAANSQIILSTQSSFLMNLFEPEDIIIVSAEKGYTEFKRLPNIEELIEWYGDYTLAELWEKNLIGGRR